MSILCNVRSIGSSVSPCTSFSLGQIRTMIEEKRNQLGWEFVFFGANIDAHEVAREMHMDVNRAHNFEATHASMFSA